MTSKIHLQALWNIHYDKLFEDLDKLRNDWDSSLKTCKCKNPECKHYQKIKWEKLGSKMTDIFSQSVRMNALSFMELANQSQSD